MTTTRPPTSTQRLDEHADTATLTVLDQIPASRTVSADVFHRDGAIYGNMRHAIRQALDRAYLVGGDEVRTEMARAMRRWWASVLMVGLAVGFALGRVVG